MLDYVRVINFRIIIIIIIIITFTSAFLVCSFHLLLVFTTQAHARVVFGSRNSVRLSVTHMDCDKTY